MRSGGPTPGAGSGSTIAARTCISTCPPAACGRNATWIVVTPWPRSTPFSVWMRCTSRPSRTSPGRLTRQWYPWLGRRGSATRGSGVVGVPLTQCRRQPEKARTAASLRKGGTAPRKRRSAGSAFRASTPPNRIRRRASFALPQVRRKARHRAMPASRQLCRARWRPPTKSQPKVARPLPMPTQPPPPPTPQVQPPWSPR
mmetsp:Transcript_21704/g.46177  ORF Transcript_21704/g.46177 Transcript_21704/m.46177 type:complete len:200 (-) Transcript_21704:554-1153(-)